MTILPFLASLIAPGAAHIARGDSARGLKLYVAGLVASWGGFVLLFRTFTGLLIWAAGLLAYGVAVGYASVRRQPQPLRKRRIWLGVAAVVAYPCLLLASLIGASPLRLYHVPTESMAPAIEPDEIIVVDRWAYPLRPVRRGDVVVFIQHRYPNLELVKRVVGLGGERVAVLRNRAFIGGSRLAEPYLPPGNLRLPTEYQQRAPTPPGSVFVLGDNRTASIDSRTMGAVPEAGIVGHACYVLHSPQFQRIGRPL